MRQSHPGYHNRPVPAFGDAGARLLIVGLAPGMHGANASGRPFTGDHAGILLYRTLFELGLATAAESIAADDPLRLRGCRITNAVKCLPPENKPTGSEIRSCNEFLKCELARLPRPSVIVALGGVAHRAILMAAGLKQSAYSFGHGREHELAGLGWLLDSYHCSRYNTQTGRLTSSMFMQVLKRASQLSRCIRD
jgi:uracil-DNA glycosylase family 4